MDYYWHNCVIVCHFQKWKANKYLAMPENCARLSLTDEKKAFRGNKLHDLSKDARVTLRFGNTFDIMSGTSKKIWSSEAVQNILCQITHK